MYLKTGSSLELQPLRVDSFFTSSSVMFLYCILNFISMVLSANAKVGFYTENLASQQTVPLYRLPRTERREMQKEILTLLGLHRRPKVLPREGVRNSAPQYLLTLYKNLMKSEKTENDVVDHFSLYSPTIRSLPGNHNDSFGVNEDTWAADAADVIMSFPNQPNKLRRQLSYHEIDRLRHQKDQHFYFDTSEVQLNEDISIAEVRLFKTKIFDEGLFGLRLSKVARDEEGASGSADLTDSITTSSDFEGWLTFDVTSAVESWVVDPNKNLGLFLTIERHSDGKKVQPRDLGLVGNAPRRHVAARDDDDSLRRPFMVVFFAKPTQLNVRRTRAARKRNKNQRKNEGIPTDVVGQKPTISNKKRSKEKRASSGKGRRQQRRSDIHFNDNDNSNLHAWGGSSGGTPGGSTYAAQRGNAYSNTFDPMKRSCQKHALYVSFRDLGWQDWIIAPEGYEAYYCLGECSFPLNAHMNATNHAIVQTLVHLMNPKDVPKPCCAPTKLSAISVLYFDDHSNVILKKYKNMVVKSCGCH